MIYSSGKVDCYGAYDYVEGMLKTIGEVKAFRIFYEDNEKYCRVVNGQKEYYRFIIFNSQGDEFWLDGICGYSGTGPTYTKKMLEVLGIDGDFKIFERKEVYVDKVIQQYKMNILIGDTNDYEEFKPYFMLKIEFYNGYDRVMFSRILKSIGYMNEYRHNDEILSQYEEYFKECPETQVRFGEYRENEILNLDRRMNALEADQVVDLIETLVAKSNKKEYSIERIYI